jgi:RNA-directed DNA polymerase
MANQPDPESCAIDREVYGEVLTGEISRPAIELRNHNSGTPMLLSEAEGNTGHDVTRLSGTGPARSENLCMLRSLLYGSWEISTVPTARVVGGAGKAKSHTPAIYAGEKSDTSIRPERSSNKENQKCPTLRR